MGALATDFTSRSGRWRGREEGKKMKGKGQAGAWRILKKGGHTRQCRLEEGRGFQWELAR